jgi:hypothetical protein
VAGLKGFASKRKGTKGKGRLKKGCRYLKGGRIVCKTPTRGKRRTAKSMGCKFGLVKSGSRKGRCRKRRVRRRR